MNLTPVFAIFGLWNCAEHDHDLAAAMRILMLQCSNPLKLTSEGVSFNQKNPRLMAVSSTPITKLLNLFSGSYEAYLKFVRRIIRNKCRTLIIPILWHTAKRPQLPETVSKSSICDATPGRYFGCHTREQTLLGAEEIQRLGLQANVALLSDSSFASHESKQPGKCAARGLLEILAQEPAVDGEMHADVVLSGKHLGQAYQIDERRPLAASRLYQ